MAKEPPRGKERIRRWYAARSSADTAGLAKLSTQQSDKPRTDQPVRGKDRIRAMYDKPSGAGGDD